MNHRARNLISAALLLAGLTAANAAPIPGLRQVLGAGTLAAQTVRQFEERQFLEARRAINAEEFERAAELFQEIRTKAVLTPRFEPDSYYWEAFARYRLGDLAEARLLLETLMVGFYEAQEGNGRDRETGRLYHDARALDFEIRSQLASSGDGSEAEALLRDAEATLDASGFRARPVEADSMVGDSAAAPSRAEPDSPGKAPVASVATHDTRNVAAYERRAAEYERQAAEYERQVVEYERQSAEYQEAGPTPAREQEACEDVSVQMAALEALMRFEINRVQVLRRVLDRTDECSRQLHEQAVRLVAREEGPEAAHTLLNVIQSNEDWGVRRTAVGELWRFDGFDAFSVLLRLVSHSGDPVMQQQAIYSLGRSPYVEADIQRVLAGVVAQPSNQTAIRAAAISALGRRPEVTGMDLVGLYESLDSDDLRETLLNELEREMRSSEDWEAAAWAHELFFDVNESADVRGEAFGAWAAHSTVTLAYLAGLYGELSEAFLKRSTIYAIYQRARFDPEAPRVLMELIRDEPDHEVRERGIYWLGRTESEEAVNFLLELLRTPAADTASHSPVGPHPEPK